MKIYYANTLKQNTSVTYHQKNNRSIEIDAKLSETQNVADKYVKNSYKYILYTQKGGKRHGRVEGESVRFLLGPKGISRNEKYMSNGKYTEWDQ